MIFRKRKQPPNKMLLLELCNERTLLLEEGQPNALHEAGELFIPNTDVFQAFGDYGYFSFYSPH